MIRKKVTIVKIKYYLHFDIIGAKLLCMVINEIFYSIQGEGSLAGMPSVFIRLAGCPLRCKWCDTKYAWSPDAGTTYSVQHLLGEISRYPAHHVVITGGEPFACDKLPELCAALKSTDVHITIETAGIKYIENLSCDLMSISPKLDNSIPADPLLAAEHEKYCHAIESYQRLIEDYNYQIKFVVDAPEDLDDIARTLSQLKNVNPNKIFLMPQAVSRDEYIEKSLYLVEVCKQTGFAYSPRLQVALYNRQKGK